MKSFLQLLRSMRFAIAILTVVAVASAIGSVLEQNQPYAVYVGRYGEFWARMLVDTCLTDIYHALWFFVLLAFMASSTGLCLIQNTPSMLREMRGFRENKSLQSLMQLPHSAKVELAATPASVRQLAGAYLLGRGYRYKVNELSRGAYVIAARSGGMRRAGYILLHAAIVVICVGGMVDGNVGLRLKMLSGDLVPETRNLLPADVPQRSRLDADSGSFRGSLTLAEGESGHTAYLPLGDGYLLQELPFSVKLHAFRIDHYANGQAKDFASDVEILDGETRERVTLRVNHPHTYRGVTLFQSGFDDGGSTMRLNMHQLGGEGTATPLEGRIGSSLPLLLDGEPYSLELKEFRRVNVFTDEAPAAGLGAIWFSRRGNNSSDVGPSLSFLLRDKLGQASEWNVYMRPIAAQGASYLVIGRREQGGEALRHVRLPVDADGGLASYRRLSGALGNQVARAAASGRISANVPDGELADSLRRSGELLLESFAREGFRGVMKMVESSVPPAEQEKAATLYLDLLEHAAQQVYRGTDPAPERAPSARFVRDSLLAYNDSIEAGIPVFFELAGFEQRNATVLQLTRAPGAFIVYLGTALLALGTCAMYFVQERRLWLRVVPELGKAYLGYAANRSSPGLSDEFEVHRSALTNLINRKD